MTRATGAEPLDGRDLARVLKVVEACGRQPGLDGFRESVVESLPRHFGYRHVTFFTGTTAASLFADARPVVNGVPRQVVRRYVEEAHHTDPFAQYASLHGRRQGRVLSLDRLDPDGLPGSRQYLESFLFRSGIYAKLVILLRAPGASAGIGLLGRDAGCFGPRDIALARLMSVHLENLFRLYSRQATASAAIPSPAPLSPRQAEVAALVARGLTNREIAEALDIGTDTVKKHLTRALELTGCTNRTQLALEWKARCVPDSP
jgi:DNA-binding CsgD family transcriptional regulator